MSRFIRFCLASILAIYLAANVFTGIHYEGITGLLESGILLALVLLFLRPIIMVIILPLNMLTMGVFGLIINAWMVQITGMVSDGFQVVGFWSALGVALIALALNWIQKRFLKRTGFV